MTFNRHDHFELVSAAYWLHRHDLQSPDSRTLVSLNAPLMARLLHRKLSGPSHVIYTAETWDGTRELDHITCGLRTVWKTGAQQIVQFCLDYATEYDLSLHDWVEWRMWQSHVTRLSEQGHAANPNHAPTYYRHGQSITQEQAHAAFQANKHPPAITQLSLFAEAAP